MTEMTVWLKWKEQTHEMTHRRYIGNGESVPMFKEGEKIVRCRYSSEVTDEMIQRAHDYVEKYRPDAWVEVSEE